MDANNEISLNRQAIEPESLQKAMRLAYQAKLERRNRLLKLNSKDSKKQTFWERTKKRVKKLIGN